MLENHHQQSLDGEKNEKHNNFLWSTNDDAFVRFVVGSCNATESHNYRIQQKYQEVTK